jgi:hypothetical protein
MSVDDIRQPEQLVSRLRDPHDTVGAYLRKHFTPEGREQIDRYDDTEPPSPTLLATVVAELNGLLTRGDLLTGAVARLPLRKEVRKRLQWRARPADLVWTNRFRLEVVLPELAPTPLNRLELAGAELFTGRSRHLYSQAVERSMGRLETLDAIDAETRDRMWNQIVSGAHDTALVEVQKAAVRRRLLIGALIVAAVVFLAMPLLAWRLGGRPPVSWQDLALAPRYLVGIIVILLVIGAFVALGSWLSTRLLLLRPVHDTRYYAIAFVSWPGLVIAYSIVRVAQLLEQPTLDAIVDAAAHMAAGALWLVLLGGLALAEAARWGLERSLETDHPDVVVADGLLTCLAIVDSHRHSFWMLEPRQQLANELERIAACIAREFPRRFGGRADADPWVAQTAHELAFAVRKLKRWVATPRLDTAEHLIERLRTDLEHAAAGAWGHLERCAEETVPAPPPPGWREQALSLARTVVVAGLPLAVVVGSGAWGLSESLRNQLTVSAGVWAVLTILVYLEPKSREHLASLRDALPHAKGKD